MNERRILISGYYGFGITRYAEVPLLGKIHGKHVMFYSQGLRPLFSKELKTFVSFICSLADIITTREDDFLKKHDVHLLFLHFKWKDNWRK